MMVFYMFDIEYMIIKSRNILNSLFLYRCKHNCILLTGRLLSMITSGLIRIKDEYYYMKRAGQLANEHRAKCEAFELTESASLKIEC